MSRFRRELSAVLLTSGLWEKAPSIFQNSSQKLSLDESAPEIPNDPFSRWFSWEVTLTLGGYSSRCSKSYCSAPQRSCFGSSFSQIMVVLAAWCSWSIFSRRLIDLLCSGSGFPFWLELQCLSEAIGGTFARQQSQVLRFFFEFLCKFYISFFKHAWFLCDEIWNYIWFSYSTTCRLEVSLHDQK